MGVTPPCLVTGPRALPIAYAARLRLGPRPKGNNTSTTRAPPLLRQAARDPTALPREPGHRPPAHARDWTYELPHTSGWTAWKAVPYRLRPLGP